MSNYEDMKKEELLEEARNREGLSGYSDKNKDELVDMLKEHDQNGSSSDGAGTSDGSEPAYKSEASDLDNPEVESNLSESGQEAAEKMSDESKELADAALDASGPLHLQAPEDRVMTGAVNEEQAKEQEELLKDKPEDYTGEVNEAGQTARDLARTQAKGEPKDNLSENDERDPEDVLEVRQEHVIDYPAPLAEREEAATGQKVKGDETAQAPASGTFSSAPLGSASTPGARSHLFEQKAQFYTDGLSGGADHNHERAYEIPEKLQSNDPEVRKAGDESISEAAEEQRSDSEKREAKEVEGGARENE